ncbi:MAG: Ig-like domain-containing protein [Candidatus Delongbacteria bacterium]|nr:Ig-like domain-containing protein [Candidatus Delongbacteria bacterium]
MQLTSGIILAGGDRSITWYPQFLGTDTISCEVSDGESSIIDSVLILVTESDPPITSSLSANPTSLKINENSIITCIASHLDGDSISYNWEKTGGSLIESNNIATWTAPDIIGLYVVTCNVSDSTYTTSKSIEISVDNSSPLIQDIVATPSQVMFNDTTIIICTASDENGDSLNYLWESDYGEIVGNDLSVEWIAPSNLGEYLVRCLVRDYEYSVIDSLFITVIDTIPPSVTVLNPTNLSIFNEGDRVTIQGQATDNKSVTKVEFYIDYNLVGDDYTSPYEFTWDTTGEVGNYPILLKAYDPSGNIGESAQIVVRVD